MHRQSFAFESLEPRIVLSLVDHTLVELQTNFGDVWLEMLDQEAPITVQNFLDYVNTDHYDGTIFHRVALDSEGDGLSILQGGGFTYDETTIFDRNDTDDPIVNEFDPVNRSNVEMTVAMAKTSDPDSATDQFYFNVIDNSGPLDNENNSGGFTVFARVVAGWDVVLEIMALEHVNFGSGFTKVPVTENFDGDPQNIDADWFVYVNDAVTVQASEILRGSAQSVISGTADATNDTTIVMQNANGTATAFTQNDDGDWEAEDLLRAANETNLTANAVTWTDPKDGVTYAAVPTAGGLLLYTKQADNSWTVRNLQDETNSLSTIEENPTVFTSQDGLVTVAGINGLGDLVRFSQNGTDDGNGNFQWSFVNIVVNDLIPQSLTRPVFESGLSSYVTTWNGQNITGVDADGDIIAVWWAPGLERWTMSNLSEITGAPAITGGVAPYLTSWGGINLAGVNADGEVVTTWWVPSFGGDWQTTNLTDLYDGPVVGGGISSYVTSWDGLNIAGVDGDGNVQIYWWAPGLDVWNVTAISDLVTEVDAPASNLTGFASPTGTINLTGLASDGDVIRYSWDASGDQIWRGVNLTDDAAYRA